MRKRLVVFLVTVLLAGVLWSDILELASKELLDRVEKVYSLNGRNRVEGWFQLLKQERNKATLNELESLKKANDYFNETPWVSDQKHWGQSDYWATPVEMLGSNGGDCEDFAVGKYFSLSEIQFDRSKLRIMYVKSLTFNQAHMVLAYYPTPNAEPLVLDNINKAILPASQRQDLIPIYSFDGDNIWLAKSRGRSLDVNSQKSLPKWADLIQRMKEMRHLEENKK